MLAIARIVNMFLQQSFEFQQAFVFLVSLFVAGQINRGIYRLAWFPRSIGPWSAPHDDALPRHWFDRIPVVGWLGLKRESAIHGAGFWIRPMLLEVAFAVGCTLLYRFEMHRGLLPMIYRQVVITDVTILSQFLAHFTLIALMTVATFIDFDEQTIPDAITVPGTLLMLTFAALMPLCSLPIVIGLPPAEAQHVVEPLLVTSPNDWPDWLNGLRGLLVGTGCFVAWCYALVPKTWTARRGLVKAFQYLIASIFRTHLWWQLSLLALVGGGAISLVWSWGGMWWKGLLSALIGMAFGGGLIWIVRIVGGVVLQKEAMGFGDVTLMAMIGAYAGWQTSLMVFFLAPFAALVISVLYWIFTRRRDIAFGPYLCTAALFLIVRWGVIWEEWARMLFAMGWFLIGVLLLCFAAMAVLLMAWRLVEGLIYGRE